MSTGTCTWKYEVAHAGSRQVGPESTEGADDGCFKNSGPICWLASFGQGGQDPAWLKCLKGAQDDLPAAGSVDAVLAPPHPGTCQDAGAEQHAFQLQLQNLHFMKRTQIRSDLAYFVPSVNDSYC